MLALTPLDEEGEVAEDEEDIERYVMTVADAGDCIGSRLFARLRQGLSETQRRTGAESRVSMSQTQQIRRRLCRVAGKTSPFPRPFDWRAACYVVIRQHRRRPS